MPHKKKSFTFNGIKKSWIIMRQGREKAPFASLTRNVLTVPGMPGGYLQSTDIEPLIINQPIAFFASDDEHALQLKDELAAWLVTDEPAPLQFDDEPGRTYYAVVQNTLEDFEKFVELRQGTIQFLCLDPFAYGPVYQSEFENDAVTAVNEGTAEAFPIIEATAKESVTSFMVTKGEQDYFMVGRPFDIDLDVIEQYPEVARWNMDTLTGWSHVTEGFFLDDEVTGGTVSGSNIEVVGSGGSFTPVSYGSPRSGWYGPAVRTSLPQAVGDFSITLGCQANNNGNGIGKVMAIFLDENDDIVASIGLINARMGTQNVRVLARMNDGQNIVRRRVMDYPGDTGPESTVFSRRSLNIRLRREGNKFEAYTWQVREDGTPHARHGETIIDDTPEFQRPIHQVLLFFARYENYPVFPMYIHGLRVHENNTLLMDESMIPYIAHEGDQIRIDSKNEIVSINGEPATHLKDFGSNYFTLSPGVNHLFVFPENSFETVVKWQERFK